MSLAKGSAETKDEVKEYYGKLIKKSEDLELKACTTLPGKVPKFVRDALSLVADEVSAKYYGCGLIVPEILDGKAILDLGSGSGRDCYMLSRLVGENGSVTGIDMTEEQLAVANKYHEYHREKYGYAKVNTTFVCGYIERLLEAGLKENSFDIIISNCVVNLSPDKRAVLSEAYKVLKDGGEFYFSDIYADCDLPEDVRKHKVLWGECISGALWWKDLFSLAEEIGFTSPRLVKASPVAIDKPELKEAVGSAQFVSVTYRLFKLPTSAVEEAREVIYEGGILGAEDELLFDSKYTFKSDDMKVVDGETAAIIQHSRFSCYFSCGNKKPSCCPSGKEEMLDPFEYIKNEGCAAAAAAGACCC